MIEPAAIPLFTGDLGQLEQHIDALRDESDGVRQAGGEAHRQFQGLSAFYEAPEAEDLFASTAPARDAADSFGDKLATVADALRTYAAEVAPIAKRLQQLQSQAATFVAGLKTSTGEIDEKWAKDPDKVDEHRALLHDVNAAQHAFAAAEIACNNKITALVGGTQYVLNTGAKQFVPLGAHLYGYSTDVLDQAEELPWGSPVTQHHDWWDVDDFDYYLQHTVKSFVWDGLIVDNVWGTVDGILSMSGMNGEQAFKDTWSGLARVVVGAETYLMEAGGQEPEGVWATEFAQGSKVYAKEFGKSLVAWDMWSENPARASATVVFNVLTLGVGPLKVASAGKAGTTAKVAATVAKVGDAIDPISAAAKVTGGAVPRIAAVTERLRGTGRLNEAVTSTSVLEFSDQTGRSVLVVQDGQFIVVKDGEVLKDAPLQERSLTSERGSSRAGESQLAAVGADRAASAVGGRGAASANLSPAETGAGGSAGGSPGDGTATAVPGQGPVGGGYGSGQPDNTGNPPLERQREIMRQQVERANNDPRWFKDHYRSNGYRRSTAAEGGYGQPVPQLARNPFGSPKWIAVSDMPPAIRERYVQGSPTEGLRSAVDDDVLSRLDEQGAKRDKAIAADKAAETQLKAAEKAYAANRTEELAAAMDQADSVHSPLHGDANKQSELFGEEVAERHAVPESFKNPVRVDDGEFGNNRFDQVYRTSDGRYVVVEAKGSTTARLGVRKGHSGRLVTQGTREYFDTILQEMRARASRNENKGLTEKAEAERGLADDLSRALDESRVDYVLVKAKADGPRYVGYEMKRFKITK
ncbi:hypothetical protein ACFUAC_09675 [Streptomyces sp. NPDC057148]|uniref:hypothetical protein n=1 Tax=unclassified Streptomyces TaxID=2593676 RepID=UPI0036312830